MLQKRLRFLLKCKKQKCVLSKWRLRGRLKQRQQPGLKLRKGKQQQRSLLNRERVPVLRKRRKRLHVLRRKSERPRLGRNGGHSKRLRQP